MSVDIKQVIDSGLHVATLKNEAHPKTKPFWFDVVDWIVVLNPEKVAERVNNANKLIQKYKAEKKNVLVVCEKKMYTEEIEKVCNANWVYFLNHKVPSGFLSNFDTFMRRVETLNSMKRFMESEAFLSLTKKEQSIHRRKFEKINKLYSGVKNLKWRPELVIEIDWTMFRGYVKELE